LAIRIIFGGGFLNLLLAVLLAPTFADIGMAVGVVISELFVCVAMIVVVQRLTSGKTNIPLVASSSVPDQLITTE
jgi:hypothetical protein